MKKFKAIYLRVSKKELDEKMQLPIILKHFNLKENDCIILQERISGYKEEVQSNRKELIKLLELAKDGLITDIYIYSLERIYRNIDWLLKFYFDCRVYGVEIHSYLQPEINKFDGSSPINTFLKYQSVLVNGFMAQQESFLISERTKKSFVINDSGDKESYKGNKLGRKSLITKDLENKIIGLSANFSYSQIVDIIFSEDKLKISKGSISRIIKEWKN